MSTAKKKVTSGRRSPSNHSLRPVLFVPDLHVPYHDKRAYGLMLDVARDLKPEVIVSIGDLEDFYAVSVYSKDPRREGRLDREVAAVNEVLDDLDALGAKEKIFIEGNHTDRLRRYLEEKAPALFGLVDIPGLYRLGERGWRHVPYKEDTKLGKLYLTHDTGQAGRYAVYRSLDDYQHSVVTGHTHRLAYIVEGDATGEYRLSAQFGWLGDIKKVDYMHRVRARRYWRLAFGVGWHDPVTGTVYTTPVPIINYTAVVGGRFYSA